MRNLPARELIEATHSFPCLYMFKAIGKSENGFVARVVIAVREELGLEKDPDFTVRQTEAGRHVAVTLEPLVDDAEQVLAVYRRIMEVAGLVLLV